MKCVMVMFDSLNRHFLPPYGCDWVHSPNFRRLAERTVTFDHSYVCSMPCMPARRDLHTGRPNFLHRSWGPLEPFDDSMPEMLKRANVHTALISDHYHYWEDGGCTYHNRYSTWQFHRGQEGDPWMGQVAVEPVDERALGRSATAYRPGAARQMEYQDRINRKFVPTTADLPQSRTFAAGLEFIQRNRAADGWFLQIETFDPHEPFFTHREFKDLYARHYDAWRHTDDRLWDWPTYARVEADQRPALVEHMRHQYASLLSMCDARLGDVLDTFDRLDLWKDTMLVVWTDHGFLLGEHDWWAKLMMPWWNELAHTPFFVWDPRCGQRGQRRQALVQPAIDLAPTLLRYFGQQPTADMRGFDLAQSIATDAPVRRAGIFGQFGSHVNVTDGRYVYMRSAADPRNEPLNEYTLMPTHMSQLFTPQELRDRTTLAPAWGFTKGCPLLRIRKSEREPSAIRGWSQALSYGHLLYDTQTDPGQQKPLQDPALEARMIDLLTREMARCDCPIEQFERLGLPAPTA